MQVAAIYAINSYAVNQGTLEAHSLVVEEGRNELERVVGIVRALTVNEETCSLVLDSIDRSNLVCTLRQNGLASLDIELGTISCISLSSVSYILGRSILEENLVDCCEGILESLSTLAQLSIGSNRIDLELGSMEVGPQLVILALVCNLGEGIEFHVTTTVCTISLGQDEAQVAVSTAQVNRLTGNRLVLRCERSLDVTNSGPVLAIITTHNIHMDNMTVSSTLTTCYINLDKSGNGLVELNLQISGLQHVLVVIAVPVGRFLTIDKATDVLTLATIAGVT